MLARLTKLHGQRRQYVADGRAVDGLNTDRKPVAEFLLHCQNKRLLHALYRPTATGLLLSDYYNNHLSTKGKYFAHDSRFITPPPEYWVALNKARVGFMVDGWL